MYATELGLPPNEHNLRIGAVRSDAEHRRGNSGVAPSQLTVKGAMEASCKHSYLNWFGFILLGEIFRVSSPGWPCVPENQ